MTYGHMRADCLYTGISSGPNAGYRVWEAFTFAFTDDLYVSDAVTQLRVYSSPDKLQTTKYALNISVEILNKYEELFGLRYPLPKLGIRHIPSVVKSNFIAAVF